MSGIELPIPPSDHQSTPDEALRVNMWRYLLRLKIQDMQDEIDAIEVEAAIPTPVDAAWGFYGNVYPLRTAPKATSDCNGMLAWCLESDTPVLAFCTSTSYDKVYLLERSYDRWDFARAGSATLSGAASVTVSGPGGICYVPLTGASGTGSRRGKFWVGNDANDTITTIDPHNSYATSTFTIGASETGVTYLHYDAENDRVFAITAGATRIVNLDPTDGSNDAQSTGWTALTHITTMGTKLWLTKTSGAAGTQLQYHSVSSIGTAATSSGISPPSAGFSSVTPLPEIDRIAVLEGGGSNNVLFVDATAVTLESTLNCGVNLWNWNRAWIPDHRVLVLGGVTYAIAVDVITGATSSRIAASALPNAGGNNVSISFYIPEYKEVIVYLDEWLVFPTPTL